MTAGLVGGGRYLPTSRSALAQLARDARLGAYTDENGGQLPELPDVRKPSWFRPPAATAG